METDDRGSFALNKDFKDIIDVLLCLFVLRVLISEVKSFRAALQQYLFIFYALNTISLFSVVVLML